MNLRHLYHVNDTFTLANIRYQMENMTLQSIFKWNVSLLSQQKKQNKQTKMFFIIIYFFKFAYISKFNKSKF